MKGGEILKGSKPFLFVILLEIGFAGMNVISKVAFDHGMNNVAFVVYRHAVAAICIAPFALFVEKEARPKMNLSIFIKILMLSLLEPVIAQNLYFLGMKYTSATFAASLYNMLPAATFLMTWIFRLEKVEMRSIHSQAKVMGTFLTIGGAMMITLVRGPIIIHGWSNHSSNIGVHVAQRRKISLIDTIKGSVIITISCFCCASFIILQAITLKTYPAEVSLTAWICVLSTVWNAIIGLIVEGTKSSVWSIGFDIKLVAVVYGGIVCSGIAYYVQGIIMKYRGPVFIAVFSPLCMVFVAIMSFFILAEQINLGSMIGSVIIVLGLYLVVWGHATDLNKSEKSTAVDNENVLIEQVHVLDCNVANQDVINK